MNTVTKLEIFRWGFERTLLIKPRYIALKGLVMMIKQNSQRDQATKAFKAGRYEFSLGWESTRPVGLVTILLDKTSQADRGAVEFEWNGRFGSFLHAFVGYVLGVIGKLFCR
jgi:hypothetical protein